MKSRQFVAIGLAALALSACTAKQSTPAGGDVAGSTVTVNASDTGCALSAGTGHTGPTTFVVTNNGAKVTEVYVYGKDDAVLAEAEDISPGLQRKLQVDFKDAGSYTIACKPGMVGDGIRSDFTVAAG